MICLTKGFIAFHSVSRIRVGEGGMLRSLAGCGQTGAIQSSFEMLCHDIVELANAKTRWGLIAVVGS